MESNVSVSCQSASSSIKSKNYTYEYNNKRIILFTHSVFILINGEEGSAFVTTQEI